MLPYDGKIDFEICAKHIKQSGYNGTLMLEVSAGKSGYYKDLSEKEFFERAVSAVRRLCNTLEGI